MLWVALRIRGRANVGLPLVFVFLASIQVSEDVKMEQVSEGRRCKPSAERCNILSCIVNSTRGSNQRCFRQEEVQVVEKRDLLEVSIKVQM